MKKALCMAALLVLLLPMFANLALALPPTVSFSVNPSTVYEGESYTLTATVQNAERVFLLRNMFNELPVSPFAVPLTDSLCPGGSLSKTWTYVGENYVDSGNDMHYFLVAITDDKYSYEMFKSCYNAGSCPFDYNIRALGVEVLVKQETPEENLAPTAVLVADDTSGLAPHKVIFDLSESSDPEGAALAYALDFGDGDSRTGGDTSLATDIRHTYEEKGVYIAKLTVTDDEGLTDTATKVISVNEQTITDHGGGGGRGGGLSYVGGGASYGGLALGKLIPVEKYVTVDAGESISVPIEILNTGNSDAEFELEFETVSFGTVRASPSDFVLGGDEDVRSYLRINTDSDAEGQYILKVKLLQDGELVDTQNIYVTVEAGDGWTVFWLVALLIIALAGVAGLGYLVYKQLFKERTARLGLEKYY